jgi:hypothetical protein
MADKRITQLTASSGLVATDILPVVDDPGGTPETQKATVQQVADAVETIYSTDTFVLVGEYTAKGDLAVGASASAGDIATLTVGANGTVLVADSNETLGLKYADKELITVPSAQTGATYTLALTDKSSVVRMNRATAQTLTVPPNSSVAFPIGSQVIIVAMGAGAVTIAAGSGVTLRSKDGDLKIDGQYGIAACVKIDTNEWVVTGQLTS